jgi:hypothetical protein
MKTRRRGDSGKADGEGRMAKGPFALGPFVETLAEEVSHEADGP